MRQASQLLNHMKVDTFVSGQFLAQSLGVSRATICNAMHELQSWGIRINAVRGKGYCLRREVRLLDRDTLLAQLSPALRMRLSEIECLPVVDSTNSRVRSFRLLKEGQFAVCIAEMQTQGRGRRGRHWVSPFAASLYLSVYMRLDIPYMTAGSLGLHLCLAVAQWLHQCGVKQVGVKWPNDIYCKQKKLAGFLLEVSGVMDTEMDVVVGLGLNVDMRHTTSGMNIDQPFTDMVSNSDFNEYDRSKLAGQVIEVLVRTMDDCAHQRLPPLPPRWRKRDILYERKVRLIADHQQYFGEALGVDEYGRLRLRDEQHGLHYFSSGDVSVREAER